MPRACTLCVLNPDSMGKGHEGSNHLRTIAEPTKMGRGHWQPANPIVLERRMPQGDLNGEQSSVVYRLSEP